MTEEILTVSALNRAISTSLERSFPLLWVGGEISNFTRATSGHWYFSLKDRNSQIRCVMFRGRNQYAGFMPRDGEAVEVRALLSMYEPRGELQLNVEAVRRAGQGSLYEAFLRLKDELAARGWFDAARKHPLPAQPRAIGIVTSPQAAALRDVLTTLARRAPHISLILYPAPVQGAGAAERLAAMLDLANARAEVDVLILCRGGGSIEDLWAFNEEVLAAALVRSVLPVVAGVGHETDVTIVDFVADLRAPTPTAAAELVSPDREALLSRALQAGKRLQGVFMHRLRQCQQQFDWLSRRLISPQARLRERRVLLVQAGLRLRHALERPQARECARIEHLTWRLEALRPDVQRLEAALRQSAASFSIGFRRQLEQRRQHLAQLAARLDIVDPQRTLERGYAVLIDERGRAVQTPDMLYAGQSLDVRLAQGEARIGVASVEPRLPHDAQP